MGIKFVNNCLLAPGNQDEDSIFYQETLRAYLVECLKAGNGLNVKLDSHILDCIVDLTQKEAIYDALIVPVDVSHEQPVARVTSVRTGLVAFFKALFLGPLFGQVRVNFGQAFSLKEYLDVTETKNAYRFKRQFSAPTSLRRHVAYDIFQINAIMCTDMVAFILVTHFPQVKQPRLLIRTKISSFFKQFLWLKGCDMKSLCRKFAELKEQLSLNYQIGFTSMSSKAAVEYSLGVIGKYLSVQRISTSKK